MLLARAWLVVVVLGLVAAGAGAIAMRVEAWTPATDGAPEQQIRWLTVHGAAMVLAVIMPALYGLMPSVMVPELVRAERMRTLPLAVLGLVLWTSGALTTIAIAATSDGWTFYDPQGSSSRWVGPALVAMGMALQTVHVLALLVANAAVPGVRRVVVLALAMPLAWRTAMVAWAVGNLARDPVVDPLAVLEARAMLGPLHVDVIAALVVLAWALARDGTRAWRNPALVLLAVGVVPASIGLGVTRRIYQRVGDLHLDDTLFVVGQLHLQATIVGCGILAGLLAWAPALFGRTPHRWTARIGGLLVCGGAIGHSVAFLVLGGRGMPRRYVSYPEPYTALQQLASGTTAAIVAGVLLLMLAIVLGRRAR